MKKPNIETDFYECKDGDILIHDYETAKAYEEMIDALIGIKDEIEFIMSYRSELKNWGGMSKRLSDIEKALKKAGCTDD